MWWGFLMKKLLGDFHSAYSATQLIVDWKVVTKSASVLESPRDISGNWWYQMKIP
jgi:hypothetical protein